MSSKFCLSLSRVPCVWEAAVMSYSSQSGRRTERWCHNGLGRIWTRSRFVHRQAGERCSAEEPWVLLRAAAGIRGRTHAETEKCGMIAVGLLSNLQTPRCILGILTRTVHTGYSVHFTFVILCYRLLDPDWSEVVDEFSLTAALTVVTLQFTGYIKAPNLIRHCFYSNGLFTGDEVYNKCLTVIH